MRTGLILLPVSHGTTATQGGRADVDLHQRRYDAAAMTIVTIAYRPKRAPRKRKAVALEVPAITPGKGSGP